MTSVALGGSIRKPCAAIASLAFPVPLWQLTQLKGSLEAFTVWRPMVVITVFCLDVRIVRGIT